MRIAIALSLAVILSSATATASDDASKYAEFAKAKVRERLKDEESARFKDVVVYPKDATTAYVCGSVNAKNSFGAYTGYERFVVGAMPDVNFATVSLAEEARGGAESVFADFWVEHCQ